MPPFIPPSSELSVYPEVSPLCSPLTHHLCGGFAIIMAGGSLVSTSSLRVLDSAPAFQPSGSALAPSSPLSPVGPPAPPGSLALVSRHPAIASGLHFSSSTSVFCRSGSATDLRILCVTWTCRLSVSTSGSTSTCSAAVGQPPGVVSPSSTMAPLSVGFAVGRHHGCGLGLAWLLWVPSVSTLAPPSI
ncbi:Intersectin-1 [Labeo rohita]|uniref:Intersectin-1 n=1 Tax=Labeo rohita TaxID=84645 RepID=A0ABQ8LZE3_LABRO|nr:Intersectin-1 [Labeo rohita]